LRILCVSPFEIHRERNTDGVCDAGGKFRSSLGGITSPSVKPSAQATPALEVAMALAPHPQSLGRCPRPKRWGELKYLFVRGEMKIIS